MPDLKLRNLNKSDTSFVFKMLKLLRGQAQYNERSLHRYLDKNRFFSNGQNLILIAHEDKNNVGLITCNKYALPRYLGFGYDIEEVVVHPRYQKLGKGKKMIDLFINWCKKDKMIRKITVKTDDLNKAGKLYNKIFKSSDLVIYYKQINLL